MKRKPATCAVLAGALCAFGLSAEARITSLEIVSVQTPTFGGLSFGGVGQYEKIFARAYAEVDPSDRRNALITDLNLAPRNQRGMVEYSVDVHILKCQLKPVQASDYKVAFTAGEWTRLQAIFPAGVCDWSRRGVGQKEL